MGQLPVNLSEADDSLGFQQQDGSGETWHVCTDVTDDGADELVVTTITHGHADRGRSYELLASTGSGERGQSPKASL